MCVAAVSVAGVESVAPRTGAGLAEEPGLGRRGAAEPNARSSAAAAPAGLTPRAA